MIRADGIPPTLWRRSVGPRTVRIEDLELRELTLESFDEAVQSVEPLAVLFWARKIGDSEFARLNFICLPALEPAPEYTIATANIAGDSAFQSRVEVGFVPTLIIYREGQEIARIERESFFKPSREGTFEVILETFEIDELITATLKEALAQ